MRGILLIILAFFFNWQTSFAAQKLEGKKLGEDTIITKIKANFIDIKRQDEVVYLYGNVIVEREDLSVLADKMMVFYYEAVQDKKVKNLPEEEFSDEENIEEVSEKTSATISVKTPTKASGIKRIEAQNNVKIFNDEFLATGKSGVFNPKENNFILENDVMLNKGGSVARGQKFIYNLTTKKGNLTGQKDIQNLQENYKDSESDNQQEEDGRVIMIINDADIKQSKTKE
jgi:lipopolysaccharide export system protein LptA